MTHTSVPAATSQALASLGLSESWIAGGSATISEGVSVALGLGTASPNRLAGATRYDTSVAIAEKALSAGLRHCGLHRDCWLGARRSE